MVTPLIWVSAPLNIIKVCLVRGYISTYECQRRFPTSCALLWTSRRYLSCSVVKLIADRNHWMWICRTGAHSSPQTIQSKYHLRDLRVARSSHDLRRCSHFPMQWPSRARQIRRISRSPGLRRRNQPIRLLQRHWLAYRRITHGRDDEAEIRLRVYENPPKSSS